MIVVPDGRIQLVNLKCEQIFGYARAELIGQHLEILIPERFRGDHTRHLARFFAQPEARLMGSGLELFGRRKDGSELPIEVSISPLRSGNDITVSASLRDISERKRAEALAKWEDERQAEELRAARTAAEAGSAAKSEFLSSMSHELRTPLNGILGFSQLLLRDQKLPLTEPHRDRVRQIERSGEHLLRLISDILDLSRIEAGGVTISTEPVNAAEVLEEVMRTLEPMAAHHGIRVEIDAFSQPLPLVSADRTRFAQILMNFGSNGIKYNRAGGTLVFGTFLRESDLRIVVRDSGIGIPPEKQRRLFQPFQRAGQETGQIEGTGIGLVITKRLAQLMGGDVGFESIAGVGSSFWVDLPLHLEREPSTVPPPQPDSEARRFAGNGTRLVLYVEDNPGNVTFMRDLVSSFESIELIVASTAESGIEIAFARQPEVIIMDINLPGMSGLEALETLNRMPALRHIPVIALTAAATEEDRRRGARAGFYRYLTKPVKVDELLNAIEAVLDLAATS